MLRQRHEQIQLMVRVTDVVVCIAAFFAAFWIRFRDWPFSNVESISSLNAASWMLAASLVLHLLIYPVLGFYQSLRLKAVSDIIVMTLKALLIEFFVLGSLVFLFQEKTVSRYFFGLFLVINYILVLAEKLGARVLLTSIRKRGYNFRHILVYGNGKNAFRTIEALRRNRHWGYVPFGVLKETKEGTSEKFENIPVIGELSDLQKIISERTVDELLFAPDVIHPEVLSEAVLLCERLGIPVRMSFGLFDLSHSKVTFSNLDMIPVLTFYTTLKTPTQAFLKRFIDVCIALVGLVITAALYPWIAYRIRKDCPGPVIFKQTRVGENGRRFTFYKFRTMYLDAEQKKKELVSANQMQGPIFKIDNDPRITPFGSFLRRTSLDELPQFLNILRGDMSVVGTRPPTPEEVSQYAHNYRRRLSIRPGLTGLWQVSGRNQLKNFEEVLALDLEYIDHWSIWLDLRIIMRTLWIALSGRGAY